MWLKTMRTVMRTARYKKGSAHPFAICNIKIFNGAEVHELPLALMRGTGRMVVQHGYVVAFTLASPCSNFSCSPFIVAIQMRRTGSCWCATSSASNERTASCWCVTSSASHWRTSSKRFHPQRSELRRLQRFRAISVTRGREFPRCGLGSRIAFQCIRRCGA